MIEWYLHTPPIVRGQLHPATSLASGWLDPEAGRVGVRLSLKIRANKWVRYWHVGALATPSEPVRVTQREKWGTNLRWTFPFEEALIELDRVTGDSVLLLHTRLSEIEDGYSTILATLGDEEPRGTQQELRVWRANVRREVKTLNDASKRSQT